MREWREKMDLSFGEIAKACGGKLTLSGNANDDTCVTDFEVDSRKVIPGGVFVAAPGEHADGHSFAKAALDKGAILLIVSKTPQEFCSGTGENIQDWGSYVLVEDTLQALKDIAEYYRSKLNVKVVGITGSSGKTSTKELIAEVLSGKYSVLKTEGNFNNEIGVPLTLLRIRSTHQAAVVEMGISDFGEMHRLSRMAKPDICVITNIGQSHLDNLKSRDGILKAKSEIFDFMAQDAEICLNGEDDKLAGLGLIKGRRPLFFGLGTGKNQTVYASDIKSLGLWGSDAVIHIGEETFPVHVPLPGTHMVLNAAAAACVASVMGLTPRQIAEGIERTKPVSGRERLIRMERYTVIDDCYNANPASMKAALDLLSLADTEKVAILGDMFGLGEDNEQELHEKVGAYAVSRGIGRILCVGERSAHMFEAACAHAAQKSHIVYFPNLDAVLAALEGDREEYVPDGCTVLVKASHAMKFENILGLLCGERSCDVEK